jgi:hypothetical protein
MTIKIHSRYCQRVGVLLVLSAVVISTVQSRRRVAPAGVSRADPPTALPEIDGPQAASLSKSESQTTKGAQSAVDRNKQTPASHKIQSLEEGVWEKKATKPSAGIPFDSVVTPTQPHEPQPPQGFAASAISAKAGRAGARPPSAGGLLANGSRSETIQWQISRYVPRPPWRSSGGSTPSVPRPTARRVPRASQGSGY